MENLVQDIEVDKSKRSQQRKFDSAESMTAEERRTFKSISQAANQLLEIKDIRDELNMLKSIVSQQKKVWDELVLGAPKNVNSRNAAEYTIANIQGMDLVASRIQDAVSCFALFDGSGCDCLRSMANSILLDSGYHEPRAERS